MLIDEGSTGLGMRQTAFTATPGSKADFGKGSIDCSYDSLSPLSLGLLVQVIFEHHLHQPMQVEYIGFRIALDQ